MLRDQVGVRIRLKVKVRVRARVYTRAPTWAYGYTKYSKCEYPECEGEGKW